MQAITSSREREVARLIDSISAWARKREDLRAVALVGSWARGSPRMDSDVDVVLLTDDTTQYTDGEQWTHEFGALAIVVSTQDWGVLTERRFALPSGLEVDVGVVGPSWACTAPLDEGTVKVVSDGLVALHDPDGLLAAVVNAVASRR